MNLSVPNTALQLLVNSVFQKEIIPGICLRHIDSIIFQDTKYIRTPTIIIGIHYIKTMTHLFCKVMIRLQKKGLYSHDVFVIRSH
jgi:hypothetical protein